MDMSRLMNTFKKYLFKFFELKKIFKNAEFKI
jgi:hypothetical protein